MDAVADMRRKNVLQPESMMALNEIQRSSHEKGNPHQSSGEEDSKAAHDVAELKDYVRVSILEWNGCRGSCFLTYR